MRTRSPKSSKVAWRNAYERLALVAPPHFLGLLRATISSTVAKRVELTVDKDYTALKADELAERILV